MKFGIISLLLLSSQIACAQVFTVEKIVKNSDAYQFPLIHSTQRPDIAAKINSIIQKAVDPDSDPRKPFENVSGEDEYSFETGGVNERLLSLVITGSHSGAGYHVSRYSYNFDSRTGEPVDLNNLFGSDGQLKLRKVLCKYWKDALKANQESGPEGEYKNCLANSKTTTEVSVERMLIFGPSIKFWAGSCLDGSNHEYDNSTGPHELQFSQLLPMLTSYGYSLFVDSGTAPFRTLLRGTIDGKYPISLTLFEAKDGTLNGFNVYDRVGTPILLDGKMEGNSIILHEVEGSSYLSDIALTWSGTQLSGTFINLKTKKQMSFVAAPVR